MVQMVAFSRMSTRHLLERILKLYRAFALRYNHFSCCVFFLFWEGALRQALVRLIEVECKIIICTFGDDE